MSTLRSVKIKIDSSLRPKETNALGLFTESWESNGERRERRTLETTHSIKGRSQRVLTSAFHCYCFCSTLWHHWHHAGPNANAGLTHTARKSWPIGLVSPSVCAPSWQLISPRVSPETPSSSPSPPPWWWSECIWRWWRFPLRPQPVSPCGEGAATQLLTARQRRRLPLQILMFLFLILVNIRNMLFMLKVLKR